MSLWGGDRDGIGSEVGEKFRLQVEGFTLPLIFFHDSDFRKPLGHKKVGAIWGGYKSRAGKGLGKLNAKVKFNGDFFAGRYGRW